MPQQRRGLTPLRYGRLHKLLRSTMAKEACGRALMKYILTSRASPRPTLLNIQGPHPIEDHPITRSTGSGDTGSYYCKDDWTLPAETTVRSNSYSSRNCTIVFPIYFLPT